MRNRQNDSEQREKESRLKDFLDMVSPSIIRFLPEHYLCGNTFRCVWALREYPTSTDEQALLRGLGEKDGVTLRIYTRQVTLGEEKRILRDASSKNRMRRSDAGDVREAVTAERNLQDVAALVSAMHKNREPLLHCAVYVELTAQSLEGLRLLQSEVMTELVRSKLNVDRLMLRQREGFLSVLPSGAKQNSQMEEKSLDIVRIQALFYSLYFGEEHPGSRSHRQFVDCFVRREERTRVTVHVDEEGNEWETEETYTVTVPVEGLEEIYANQSARMGLEVSSEQRENADSIYRIIHFGYAGAEALQTRPSSGRTGSAPRWERTGGRWSPLNSGFAPIPSPESRRVIPDWIWRSPAALPSAPLCPERCGSPSTTRAGTGITSSSTTRMACPPCTPTAPDCWRGPERQ